MQSTDTILLVRPSHFVFNNQTAASNAFQHTPDTITDTVKNAQSEFEIFSETLREKGVNVIVVNDTPNPVKPDAVFPNNWVTFHNDGTVVLYPMFAPNRRLERRNDIIEHLKERFEIKEVIDLTSFEKKHVFLEGTGSIVFDHTNKIAYACLSPRTDKELFIMLCEQLQYKAHYFHALDRGGKEIYHTNVMMCLGEDFAVVCMESISDPKENSSLRKSLESTGHHLIEISFAQMNHFAGNMLAVLNDNNEKLLVMSQSAYDSLTDEQKNTLKRYCTPLPLAIPTIESVGGGSARCMIAEVHLPKK